MRILYCAAILLCLAGLSAPTLAQGQAPSDDVAEGRAMVQAAREEIIRTELALSDEEGAKFWPLYKSYTAETTEIMDRYTDMITDYIQRYESGQTSNEYAEELLESYFSIKRELLDVRESYVPKFKAILPMLKVAEFYQLENKINAEIDIQLAISVPLIE